MNSKFFYLVVLSWFTTNVFAQSDQPIAQELVGKWCYINLEVTNDLITNSCITLSADGTFEATLDRSTIPNGATIPNLLDNDNGKWWVKGNRLFYNSSGSGQGSFSLQKANHPRLENTPMIVLNGISFATASSKDAW
ncbi:MAG: hypothetical protein HY015_02880 [Bacteroidetes bacterium]|nr:hypothetical protein [Bacteroidota bacterium]MBI3481914.1 hypothetical protein [Bacteroidota bacterium]